MKLDPVAVVFVVAALCAMTAPPVHARETPWKAGVARADITPQEPLWLAGYAARNHPSEGALHPLWVKALALEDASGGRGLLFTSDILGYPKDVADRICSRIEAQFGLTRAQIILSASHTHSAPVIGASLRCMYTYDDAEEVKLLAYTAWLEDRIVALAGEALANLRPAALSSGNGVARIAVNRRNNNERDLTPTTVVDGPHDHAVPVLKITRSDGAVAAIIFGYACHATVLSDYLWCGDYPGFAQLALEEAHPGATAMFFAGCGADQNALPRRSVALARQYGRTLAAAVMRVCDEPMRPLEAQLTAAYQEITLALTPPPDADILRERAAGGGGYAQSCTQALLDTLKRDGILPEAYAWYPVQLWRIGGQPLVTLGGEVVVAYAIQIKERLDGDAFVMGYANNLVSYIPSEAVLAEGGYEGKDAQLIYGMPSAWEPGLEAQILDAVTALYQESADK